MKVKKFSFLKFIEHMILIIWCASVVMFVYFIIISSFKTNRTVFTQLLSLPEKFNISNYINAWTSANFARYSLNSLIVVISSVILIIFFSSLGAYALTRFGMKFSMHVTLFFVAGLGIPSQLLFIPLYKVLVYFKIINSLIGLVVVYVALSIPFTVFLLSGFFSTLPKEIEDAAQIDGCNEFQTFYKIALPMASNGIITAVIFNFIGLWNEYMLAYIFTTGEVSRTLPLGLYSLLTSLQYGGDWVTVFAGAVIVMIPIVIMYIILSDRFISGITSGSIK